MDLVSVIVPVYNNHATLAATLDSILQQNYRPIEVIVVDDHSDDESYAFAKAYSLKNSSQQIDFITTQNEQNKGAGVTRNNALKLAKGRYIAFLDADDLWKPNKLKIQIDALKTSGRNVCYGAYEIFNSDPSQPVAVQEVLLELTYDKLHKANYLGNLTGIYDALAIGKVEIPAVRKRQDWAMWLDVLRMGGPAIGIQEPIASYRLSDGLSASKFDLVKYNFAVYHQHLGYSFLKSCWLMAAFFLRAIFCEKQNEERTLGFVNFGNKLLQFSSFAAI